MINHVVMIKFKPEVRESDIKNLEQSLDTLPNTVLEILSYEFGKNIVKSDRSFDFALVALLANTETLKRYLDHPDHLVIVDTLKPMCENIYTVDFEGTDSGSLGKDETSEYEKFEF